MRCLGLEALKQDFWTSFSIICILQNLLQMGVTVTYVARTQEH